MEGGLGASSVETKHNTPHVAICAAQIASHGVVRWGNKGGSNFHGGVCNYLDNSQLFSLYD
jgi:hypothetical protein